MLSAGNNWGCFACNWTQTQFFQKHLTLSTGIIGFIIITYLSFIYY